MNLFELALIVECHRQQTDEEEERKNKFAHNFSGILRCMVNIYEIMVL